MTPVLLQRRVSDWPEISFPSAFGHVRRCTRWSTSWCQLVFNDQTRASKCKNGSSVFTSSNRENTLRAIAATAEICRKLKEKKKTLLTCYCFTFHNNKANDKQIKHCLNVGLNISMRASRYSSEHYIYFITNSRALYFRKGRSINDREKKMSNINMIINPFLPHMLKIQFLSFPRPEWFCKAFLI